VGGALGSCPPHHTASWQFVLAFRLPVRSLGMSDSGVIAVCCQLFYRPGKHSRFCRCHSNPYHTPPKQMNFSLLVSPKWEPQKSSDSASSPSGRVAGRVGGGGGGGGGGERGSSSQDGGACIPSSCSFLVHTDILGWRLESRFFLHWMRWPRHAPNWWPSLHPPTALVSRSA